MDFSLATLLGVAEGASVWANIGAVALRVLIVLLGVNMLVIVHEWGHFIVARMCGVRCDKFYIWFDAYGFKFFSFKRGNTEYGLGWLPLKRKLTKPKLNLPKRNRNSLPKRSIYATNRSPSWKRNCTRLTVTFRKTYFSAWLLFRPASL